MDGFTGVTTFLPHSTQNLHATVHGWWCGSENNLDNTSYYLDDVGQIELLLTVAALGGSTRHSMAAVSIFFWPTDECYCMHWCKLYIILGRWTLGYWLRREQNSRIFNRTSTRCEMSQSMSVYIVLVLVRLHDGSGLCVYELIIVDSLAS